MITTVIAILVAVGSIVVQAPPPADEVVLTVNGEPLCSGELQLTAQALSKEITAEGTKPDTERLFESAVRQAIDHKLLAQEARRQGIAPAPELIDETLERYVDQAGSSEALEQDLAARGSRLRSLRAHLEEAATINLYLERVIRPGITVSDGEVEAYYEANRSRLSAPEQIRARHILFKVKPGSSEQEIDTAREKAVEAHRRAIAGEDFAALARELSEAPEGAQGGDLGFFTRKRVAPRFAEAAFALTVGEISAVVLTGYGFHVIKVEERREAGVPPLEDIKDRLYNRLLDEKVAVKVNALLETLRAKAEVVASDEGVPAP